jgi:hypothetical protein
MKELSRKIDEKKSTAPMPPIVLNMQAGGGQPPPRPITMDLPSSGPQPEGFPRYASADMDEPDEQGMQSPMDKRPPDTQMSREEPEIALEEVPEDLEPVTKEPPPADARAPAPAGWPGLEPITDSEPEPEIATEIEEEPEAELEQLEPVTEPEAGPGETPAAATAAEKATGGPRPSVPGSQPSDSEAAGSATSPRSSDDVRKELRSYLNGVRDRLDKGGGNAGPADLLDYLGKLSDYLPEREKKRFRGSTERLAMESLKARLAGRKGLRQKVAESKHPTFPRRDTPMTRSRVVDTFSYLRDLAAWHPDKAVGAAMRDRIESIVARMGRSK